MSSRRAFMKQGFAYGLATTAIASIPRQAYANDFDPMLAKRGDLGQLPILQGWTTPFETQIKVMRPLSVRYGYEVRDQANNSVAVSVADEFNFTSSTAYSIDHLLVAGLRLDETYRLLVNDGSKVIDERFFRALDTEASSARLGLLSCMHESFSKAQKKMWAEVQSAKPDVLLFIGDACYADWRADGSARDIWRRHCETRMNLDVYRFKTLIPSLAVWDDHDFGLNNSNGSFAHKSDSLRIFKGLFGSLSGSGLMNGPGVSQEAHAFGLRLSMMDDRYYRSAPNVKNGTFWGRDQEQFLAQQLSGVAKPTLLCNGSQFFGGYLQKESYEADQPESFLELKKTLNQSASPVVFCTGDVHFSEVMEIEQQALGYKTFELTSSSVHSLVWPTGLKKNPRRKVGVKAHNFLLVETQTSPGSTALDLSVASIGKGETYFNFKTRVER